MRPTAYTTNTASLTTGRTFVFFVPFPATPAYGERSAPALEKDGFGSLVWNYRERAAGSPIDAGIEITASQIAAGSISAISRRGQQVRPFIGMSIGGLYSP
ncbi:MAG: hypothetical protein R3C97_03045 [Geminicoccaceae bacterium]